MTSYPSHFHFYCFDLQCGWAFSEMLIACMYSFCLELPSHVPCSFFYPGVFIFLVHLQVCCIYKLYIKTVFIIKMLTLYVLYILQQRFLYMSRGFAIFNLFSLCVYSANSLPPNYVYLANFFLIRCLGVLYPCLGFFKI